MTGYRDIAADLTRRITDGDFAVGSTLPAENVLATHYASARGTVRHALTTLAARGMVSARQGSGWLVQSTLQHHDFSHLRSFAEWAWGKGLEPSGRVLASRRAPASAAEARTFRLSSAAEVLHVLRSRALDGRDVMIERTVYAPWMVEAIESIPADEVSVVRTLADRFGIVTAHAEHTMDAVAASTEDSRLLGVRRGSPLLRVRRVSFAQDGRPIESGDDRYLPGTIAFRVQSSNANSPLARTLG